MLIYEFIAAYIFAISVLIWISYIFATKGKTK